MINSTATIVQWHKQCKVGIIIDSYNNSYWITDSEINPQDILKLKIGHRVVFTPHPILTKRVLKLELATSSFARYLADQKIVTMEKTVEVKIK
jgi:hypothetical protein